MENVSIRDELVMRAQTYSSFCSLLLQAPDAESLRALRAAYSEAEGRLASYVRGLSADDAALERVRADLKAEFEALLLSASADSASPFESSYVEDASGTVGGIPRIVSLEYARAGFQVGEDEDLRADHLGVEMAFMARLIESRIVAIDEDDEERAAELAEIKAAFLREHLAPCAKGFCAALAAGAQSDFYRGVAEEIEGFLAFEQEGAR